MMLDYLRYVCWSMCFSPKSCGIRMRSTGGGSGLLYSLKSMVMSAGFKALRASIGAKAWAALGWAMAPFKASWIGVTFRPLLKKENGTTCTIPSEKIQTWFIFIFMVIFYIP